MNNKSPVIFLEDIVKSLQQIEGYIQGLNYITFSGNQLIVDGVIRKITRN